MPTVRSTRVVVGEETRPATIEMADGVVVGVHPHRLADHDYGDLVVMPGLVDSHVHVNDPGRADWEGFETATRAAAAGGTTTIVDMPLNSVPPTTSIAGLEAKRRAAEGRLTVDVAFWGGLVPGSSPEMAGLVEAGVCGFKAFMVDSGVPEFPPVATTELAEGLRRAGELGVPLLVHAEELSEMSESAGDPRSYATYLETRPVSSEVAAVEHLSALAAGAGAGAHVLHVSSGDAAEAIGAGQWLTGETCPHYLTFAAEEIPDGATVFKCAPPIRGAEHREALWHSLDEGSLLMVVSDHSPAPEGLKQVATGDFLRAWGGISSLQLRLAATWTGASRRGHAPARLAEWLAAAPARLAGLDDRKGAIEVGRDADLVVWDPDATTRVRGAALEHGHPLTPYEGMELRGRVVTTVLRGSEVFSQGVFGPLRGRMAPRR